MEEPLNPVIDTSPIPDVVGSLANFAPSISLFIWLLFFAILLYTTVHAVIFGYHWHVYNIAPQKFQRLTYIIYFTGILVFLVILLLSALAIAE